MAVSSVEHNAEIIIFFNFPGDCQDHIYCI